MDYDTGVVIGETTAIDGWVHIYQDVTPSALRFEEDENDEYILKKGTDAIPYRRPLSIGADSWVTEDVPDDTQVYVSDHPTQERRITDRLRPPSESSQSAGNCCTQLQEPQMPVPARCFSSVPHFGQLVDCATLGAA
ncbi:hypothetical protein [Haloarcula nitratireducens]|uniref:Uncharacterized protein n=1 Tax=Haloarcula nitratireducens TaxID=2487749 RepID=A0AAW4PKI0_9EURY|nr:hypothetical protein [Halomicroarcula nitratireducens]MBX0297717.1 hypothetical protein [Halomicroarcula nitratireducens]